MPSSARLQSSPLAGSRSLHPRQTRAFDWWPHALGGALLLVALFPTGVWAALNSVRQAHLRPSALVRLPLDYPRAVAWLNVGVPLFLALLAIVVAMSFWSPRPRSLRLLALASIALVALQALGFTARFLSSERALPPMTTGGWRPTFTEPGVTAIVVPTTVTKMGNGEIADVAWDDRAVRLQTPLPRLPELDSGFGPLLRRYGVENALDSRRRVVNSVFFKPLWTEPYSTFDAPHRGTFPDRNESQSEPGGPDTFEMIPHLLIIRRGAVLTEVIWAGEFRRIAGPVHAPRSVGRSSGTNALATSRVAQGDELILNRTMTVPKSSDGRDMRTVVGRGSR